MQIQITASRKHRLQAQPRQRCSSCQNSDTIRFQSEAQLWNYCRFAISFVFKGRIEPKQETTTVSLRAAQQCKVFKILQLLKHLHWITRSSVKCSWISKIIFISWGGWLAYHLHFSGHQKMDVEPGSKPLDVLSHLPCKTRHICSESSRSFILLPS